VRDGTDRTVAKMRSNTIPSAWPRYIVPAAEVKRAAAPGVAMATALRRNGKIWLTSAAAGIGFEWTELEYPRAATWHSDTARSQRGSLFVSRSGSQLRKLEDSDADCFGSFPCA